MSIETDFSSFGAREKSGGVGRSELKRGLLRLLGKPGSNCGVREYPVHQAQGGARRHGLRGPSQIGRSDRGALQERNRA